MMGTGPRPQLRAQDQGPQEFLTAESAFLHLGLQMPQLSGVQMEGDDMGAFSHRSGPSLFLLLIGALAGYS